MTESPSPPGTFRKSRTTAPAGFFAAEAAGLAWLAEPGVIPVVQVCSHDADGIVLERLTPVPAEPAAARRFGARLAALHDSGAPGFGWAPAEQAWFGPLDNPFPVATTVHADFTDYWVQDRLQPIRDLAAPHLSGAESAALDAAIETIATGAFAGICGGPTEPPARVHGDLWSGNVLWARRPGGTTGVGTAVGGTAGHGAGDVDGDGAADGDRDSETAGPVVDGVLIDPAAHGGHRLEDLALLALFGAPYLQDIYAGYTAAHPLPAGWQEDLPAHVLFCLVAHVHLFGSGYGPQTAEVSRAVVRAAAGRHPAGGGERGENRY